MKTLVALLVLYASQVSAYELAGVWTTATPVAENTPSLVVTLTLREDETLLMEQDITDEEGQSFTYVIQGIWATEGTFIEMHMMKAEGRIGTLVLEDADFTASTFSGSFTLSAHLLTLSLTDENGAEFSVTLDRVATSIAPIHWAGLKKKFNR